MKIGTKETRATQRFDLKLTVSVEIGDRRFDTETHNVSLGGAYLAVSEVFPLGTRMALHIALPANDPIVVGATVRWRDANGIGVQFDGLRARDVWALGKLLE